MENITVNVFDDVLYLAWEFVYLIFFTRFVCVHGNYRGGSVMEDKSIALLFYVIPCFH